MARRSASPRPIDPELIVLGGPIGANQLLLTEVQRTLDKLASAPISVAMSVLGDSAPLRKALEMARRHGPRQG